MRHVPVSRGAVALSLALLVALAPACSDGGGSAGADADTGPGDTGSGDTAADTGPGDTGPGDTVADTGPGDTGPDDTGADTGPGDTGPDDAIEDAGGDAGGDTGLPGDTAGELPDTTLPDTTPPDTTPPGDTAGDTLPPEDTDAGPGDTTDTGGDTLPEPELVIERRGGRFFGTMIQLSRTDRTLWVGTRGNPDPDAPGTIRGGLGRLDLDTGAFTLYEEALPQGPYFELIGSSAVGPVPTAGVQVDLDRYVVVAYDGLLVLEGDVFTHLVVTTPEGAPVTPIDLAITRDAIHHWAWMSSSAGLLRLNPATFAVEKVYGAAELGIDAEVGRLAIEPDTGAVYAGLYPADGSPSRVVRVGQDDSVATFVPGDQETPTGLVGDLVWSAADGAVLVALAAWDPYQGGIVTWDGATASTVVVEGQLALAATGEAGAFGPQALALDPLHHVLIVGGRIQAGLTGSKGGGLAFVDLSTPNRVAALPPGEMPFVGMHVTALAYDPETRRSYVVMRGQCSEFKLRDYGLFAFWFDDAGEVHLERPVLSGLRALAQVEGETWAALRDDNPGLACEGYPVQTGLVNLAERGVGEVRIVAAAGGGGISPMPGLTAMDVPEADRAALATWKDGFLLGPPGAGVAENPAFIGPSLELEDIAWAGPDTVWLGGRASHQPGDPPTLVDKGPRGAARLTLDAKGGIAGSTHLVVSDADGKALEGLPSNDVRAFLQETDGSMLLGCATERIDDSPWDRAEEAWLLIDGDPRFGGVVRVRPDDTLETVSPAEATPDVRALAFDAAGDLVVADAVQGLVKVSGGSPALWDAGLAWPFGSIPRALWLGEGDDLAVGLDTGLAVRFAGAEGFVGGVGHVWDIAKRGDTLVAATDEGLLVLRPASAPEPPFAALPDAGAPPFAEVLPPEPVTGCLEKGAMCAGDPDGCCPGLVCGAGFVPLCE